MGAIGLNPIRLDRIGLDPIRINAIRLGVPGAASGSDRPYIDPEVLASLKAVCISYGKSNDDPDRAIVKNLVDPDNPFIISNAAYKLNSGYGKYEEDFTTWKFRSSSSGNLIIANNSVSIKAELSDDWIIWHTADNPDFKIRIKGLPDGGSLRYRYFDIDNVVHDLFFNSNGDWNCPANTNSGNASGFAVVGNKALYVGLTVTQIPSYQGAFVTDGVDDLITSTKTVQEMGVTDEVTVVSMIHQIALNPTYNLGTTNYIENLDNGKHIRSDAYYAGKTGIYGYTASLINNTASDIKNILGDKADYSTQKNEPSQTLHNSKFSVVGRARNFTEPSSVAWYWTIIANKVLTTDQINQVIAYYNLDRCVEPTVLYDVKRQGLSNDTPDSDWYLKDYSGNGYDMILYNYAKTPESGINEDGGLQSDGVNDYGKVTGLPIYKDYTVVADREIETINGGVLSKSYVADNGSFIFEQYHLEQDSTSSFGHTKLPIDNLNRDRKISYQSKYSYNGTSLSVGTGIDGSNMWLATIRDNDSGFSNIAIYSLMSFPYSMSEFLIERQLKKHKLGTLYPDMVEFRPIVNSNVEWNTIEIWQADKPLYRPATGTYLQKDSTIGIYVKPKGVDEVTKIVVNGTEYTNLKINSNGFYYVTLPITKSPQKIDITIDEYIRYEDIDFTDCYPGVPRIYVDDKSVTWGNKLKVGDKFTFYGNVNILPEMYNVLVKAKYNGEEMTYGSIGTITKSMAFTSFRTYTFNSNEPKCILSPSRLRIPNSSYKILGYIPDISGHGNHGKINNSAYAEGSGVNADGSYQLDGVDDFITIPTLSSGGKQVLMKVNWKLNASNSGILYDQRISTTRYPENLIISVASEYASIEDKLAYMLDEYDTITYIDGIMNRNITVAQLQGITHNITQCNDKVTAQNSKSPIIGFISPIIASIYYAKMSLYDFMLFDEISTDEEILTLNEYVGIEGNTDDLFTENN